MKKNIETLDHVFAETQNNKESSKLKTTNLETNNNKYIGQNKKEVSQGKILYERVPLLRFPEFSDKWKEVNLSKIATIEMGQSPSSKYYTINEGTPFLQGNATFGYFYPNIDTYTSKTTKIVPKGKIIMSVRAPVGDLNITNCKLCIGRGLCSIITKNDNDNLYLFYLLKKNINKFLVKQSGTTYGAINKKDIKNTKVKITENIYEQKKIAKFLSFIDKKIMLLEKKCLLFNNIKNYFLTNIFNKNIRFKDFLQSWDTFSLGEIAIIKKGFTPSTNDPKNWDGNIPWLSISDMKQGKYLKNTSRFLTIKGSKGKEIIKKNTLVMSFKLTIGKLGILNKDMYSNEAICNFEWKENYEINTEFMYYYLSSINIKRFGSQAAKGITLNNKSIETIPIKLPTIKEQEKIVDLLKKIDIQYNNYKNEINKLKLFKKGILQQMFI